MSSKTYLLIFNFSYSTTALQKHQRNSIRETINCTKLLNALLLQYIKNIFVHRYHIVIGFLHCILNPLPFNKFLKILILQAFQHRFSVGLKHQDGVLFARNLSCTKIFFKFRTISFENQTTSSHTERIKTIFRLNHRC